MKIRFYVSFLQLGTINSNNCSEAAAPYCRNFFRNEVGAYSEEAMHVAAQQSSSSSRKSSIVLVVLVVLVVFVVLVAVVVAAAVVVLR